MAIDDATRLAYAEVLPDEKQAATVGFLIRAVAWFGRQGIDCVPACALGQRQRLPLQTLAAGL